MASWRTASAALLAALIAGCSSPLGETRSEQALRDRVAEAIEHELKRLPLDETGLETTQPPGEVEQALAARREELDRIGPPLRGEALPPADLGPDLTGRPQERISVNLHWCIAAAVRNNLGAQVARLQPAIHQSDVIAAEAAFDAMLFTTVDLVETDQPSVVPVLRGIPLGAAASVSERYRFETGVRQPLTSGGSLSLSTDLTRFRNTTPGFALSPDPAYTAAVRLGLTQPLLRGFGADANLATVRLSRNAERRSIQDLREQLLVLALATEAAYWSLVQSLSELSIQEWLVEEGVRVRDVLARRRELDARLAQYSEAVATVEQRRAEVIRSRRGVRAASDRLKSLINDPVLSVGSEVVFWPTDRMVDAPITFSLRDTIQTAVSNRPEIQQALLAIDDASIRQMAARNARLPLLDLAGEIAYFGLDDEPGAAYREMNDGDFVDYVLGLVGEWPLGNRAAEAHDRRARLERSASVMAYRRAVREVVADVKRALRDVVTNFELIQATRSFRIAQAENLRALAVEEQTLQGLTPEFLNLKFQRQDTFARAQQQEVAAHVNYNQALAALYRAMGTGLEMNRIRLELVDDPDQIGMDDG
jgi:outer membrane protein TolC